MDHNSSSENKGRCGESSKLSVKVQIEGRRVLNPEILEKRKDGLKKIAAVSLLSKKKVRGKVLFRHLNVASSRLTIRDHIFFVSD